MSNFLTVLKIGTCLMAAITCLTMVLTDKVDDEITDYIY